MESKTKTIMVLGGYGGVGSVLVRILLKNTDENIVVAGRTEEKAKQFVEKTKKELNLSDDILSFRVIDSTAAKKEDFEGVDLVVNVTTSVRHVLSLGKKVIEAGSDLIDLTVKFSLKELEKDIEMKNRCVIPQAGFHPGLPAAFVRHLRPEFDEYDSAIVSMAMEAHFNKPESVNEILYMVGDWNPRVCEKGVWRKGTFNDTVMTDFGAPFGLQRCSPLEMVEMEKVVNDFGIKNAGVYVIGFNKFVDYLVFPLIMGAYKLKRGLGDFLWRRLLYWSLNKFANDARGVAFVLDAKGKKEGKEKSMRMIATSDDAYLFTAVPVFSLIKQYLDGAINKPGLHMMGHIVNTESLLKDFSDFGIRCSIK